MDTTMIRTRRKDERNDTPDAFRFWLRVTTFDDVEFEKGQADQLPSAASFQLHARTKNCRHRRQKHTSRQQLFSKLKHPIERLFQIEK